MIRITYQNQLLFWYVILIKNQNKAKMKNQSLFILTPGRIQRSGRRWNPVLLQSLRQRERRRIRHSQVDCRKNSHLRR